MSGTLGGRVPVASRTAPIARRKLPPVNPNSPAAGWVELTAPSADFANGNMSYAVALGDGTILVGAGWGSGTGASACEFWIYDTIAGTYTSTGNGPTGATWALMGTGAIVDGTPYAVSNTAAGAASWTSGTWTAVTNRGGFADASACEAGGLMYVLDGGDFQSYTPGTDTWASLSYPSSGGFYSPMVGYNGFVYLFGYDSGQITFKYTPGTDTWTSTGLADTANAGSSFAACANDGDTVYLVGGLDASSDGTSDFGIYDITGNAWTAGPDLPINLYQGGGAVVGSTFYVFGVEDTSFDPIAYAYTP